MKEIDSSFSTLRIPAGLAMALVALLPLTPVSANPFTVELGTAGNFAVLAGAGITVTGPTTIVGDIGTYPNPAITGLGNVVLVGTNQGNSAVSQIGQADLLTAFNDAAGRPFDVLFTGGFDLVGSTLTSGVYRSDSSLFLSGTLTLDAQGDPDAVFIFQTGSTFITASDSMVNLINGAQACHVFLQVGSSATFGTNTLFLGNILALTDITLTTGTTVNGRVLALNGAVTLDTNVITRADCADDTGTPRVPETGGSLLLLGSALLGLISLGKRSR